MTPPLSSRFRFQQYLRKSPVLPAPMCGYSDRPFRELLRWKGAHLVYTEMFSTEALVRDDPKTRRLMDFAGEQPPVVVQIFGTRPAFMAESTRIMERNGAHVIDLNMGCPAKKIMKTGAGAALAKTPALAARIMHAMRRATLLPFTVKIRWQDNGGALEIAHIAEEEGADALTVHGRTAEQGYSGNAKWEWIAEIKQRLRIPVIGNGDVRTVADARRMLEQTGCDAVMVGRGLVGNPWMMERAARHFIHGEHVEEHEPHHAERLEVLFRHAELMEHYRGRKGLIEFRKHCANYIRGLPGARAARADLMQVTTLEELRRGLEKHFGDLSQSA